MNNLKKHGIREDYFEHYGIENALKELMKCKNHKEVKVLFEKIYPNLSDADRLKKFEQVICILKGE